MDIGSIRVLIDQSARRTPVAVDASTGTVTTQPVAHCRHIARLAQHIKLYDSNEHVVLICAVSIVAHVFDALLHCQKGALLSADDGAGELYDDRLCYWCNRCETALQILESEYPRLDRAGYEGAYPHLNCT